jgi:hypothetical protein
VAAVREELRDQPTPELVRRLLEDVQTLIDKQIGLTKQELREDVGQVAGAARTLAIGLALLAVGGISLLAGLILTIEHFTGWGWLSALVLAIVLLTAGALVAKSGAGKVKLQPLARTRETLKEDAEWAKHRLTPNGRSNPSANGSPIPSASSNDAHASPST